MAQLSTWYNDKVSEVPCSNCGGEVIEFTIPNDIWNKVIRLDGHEHANEYLCAGCFFGALRTVLGLPQRAYDAN